MTSNEFAFYFVHQFIIKALWNSSYIKLAQSCVMLEFAMACWKIFPENITRIFVSSEFAIISISTKKNALAANRSALETDNWISLQVNIILYMCVLSAAYLSLLCILQCKIQFTCSYSNFENIIKAKNAPFAFSIILIVLYLCVT